MTTSPRTKRGPYAKTRSRRRGIAAATLELLNERGDAQIGVADVATRTGLSEATVTYHFPTRDHLFVAALAEADDLNQRIFEELHLEEMDIAAVVTRLSHSAAGHPHRMRLYASQAANAANPEHPAHNWFLQHQASGREFFRWMIRRDQASGRAHEDVDPDRCAQQMIALWDGLQLQKIVDPSLDLSSQVVDAYRRLARVDLVEARRALAVLAADL